MGNLLMNQLDDFSRSTTDPIVFRCGTLSTYFISTCCMWGRKMRSCLTPHAQKTLLNGCIFPTTSRSRIGTTHTRLAFPCIQPTRSSSSEQPWPFIFMTQSVIRFFGSFSPSKEYTITPPSSFSDGGGETAREKGRERSFHLANHRLTVPDCITSPSALSFFSPRRTPSMYTVSLLHFFNRRFCVTLQESMIEGERESYSWLKVQTTK